MIDIEQEQENYKYSINDSSKGGLRKRLVNKGDSSSKFEGEGGDAKEVDVNSVQLELDSSGDENQSLIKSKKEAQERSPVCYSFRRWMGWIVSRERRSIKLDGRKSPRSFPTNRQNNQKYNIVTLIPVVLFNQFKFFYNFFFLMISLSQFIPPLKVGLMFTYVAPLVFVLMITIFKEAFDDFQRKIKDRELNNKKYE
jgi:magnesium-transporting ATPase (P-type)